MNICHCNQCPVRVSTPFKALNDNELSSLVTCKDTFVIKEGNPLFLEGEHMNGIYCISEGLAKLTKKDISGQEQTVKLIVPGTLLGQEAMLTHDPANLSAIAVEDMKVCFIPKAKMISFISGNQQLSMNMIKEISENREQNFGNLIAPSNKTDRQRITETLLYLDDSLDKNNNGTVHVKLSRRELAKIMGIPSEICNRILLEFVKSGCIEVATKKISIVDREKLSSHM